LLFMLSATAEAAVCTSLTAGNWSVAGRWSCGHVPLAADTVVIAHAVILNNNYTVAGLTVNVGATLDGNGGNVATVTGDVIVDGTVSNGARINVTGATSVISGSGTFASSRLYTSGAAVTIAAGASLNFTGTSRLYAGRTEAGATVAGSVLTINGTINSSVTTATNFLRLYATNTVIGSTGVINASVSSITYNTAAATVTNNGSVNVNVITQNAASNAWTQGTDSSLTVSAVSTVGTLDASASGNTVTYNGTSTVIPPSAGYWNLAGTIFPGACPVAYTIMGSNPCPVDPSAGSVTSGPTSCSNLTGVGTVAWSTPANATANDAVYATATLLFGATSNYLNCTGYNFSAVPGGATITGITVTVDRNATFLSGARDAFVYLIKDVAGAGVIQTAFNGATATNYTTTDVAEAHGGVNNLWGTTWTDTDVKAANFGVAFATAVTLGGTVNVDHLQVQVHYTTNPLDHVAINAPANAMALTEVPVVIAPHTSVHGAVTMASTINLSTSTGTGDWTIGSGTGVLTPGVPNSGLASYTFGAGESGVTLGFVSSAAGTVTLNVSDIWGRDLLLSTPVAEKANTITFTTPSFVFTDSACVHNIAFGAPGQTCVLFNWSPQVAGQNAPNVYITSVNTAGVPRRLSGTQTRTRDLQFGLSCHDPLANAGQMATFAGVASVTLPLCQASGALPAAWSAILTATFPAGIPSAGPFTFNYPDVGMVELWMRNSATTTQRGASGAFVVKPGGFVVSNIVRSSDGFANPAAANAAGVAFVKAGEAFTATVTATTCAPASATCTVAGAATPNYGKEISPESVKLVPALKAGLGLTHSPAITCGDATNATTCDTTTTPGTNIPKFGAFSNGAATGINFAWDEVGIIRLAPSVLSGNYLAAGDVGTQGSISAASNSLTVISSTSIAAGASVVVVGAGVGGSNLAAIVTAVAGGSVTLDVPASTTVANAAVYLASGDVGRFTLGKFALQNVAFDNRADLCQGGFLVSDGITPCAPAFTYMGEQINARFTLVPKALNGAAVQNYRDSASAASDFAKFDPTTFADLNLAAVDTTTAGAPHYLTARISNTSMPAVNCAAALCFQSGTADVTVPFTFTRGAAADGVFEAVNIGISFADNDGAPVEGPGATPGLCNNPNAANCLDLDTDAIAGNDRALLAATEFRYGRTNVSNAYGSELLGLVLPVTTEYWNGAAYVRSVDDSDTIITVALNNYRRNLNAGETAAAVSAFAGGVGRITLTAPGANNNGSVEVSATTPAYLPSNIGRATFGVYKGPFIYMREQY
jgi:MSHA biogenesis protein MshQ